MIKIYRFVVKKKYIDLLLNFEMGEAKIRDISSTFNMNYHHLSIVLDQWCKEGIINKIKSKSIYDISLTIKGKKIVECLKNLKAAIESEDKAEEPNEQKEPMEDIENEDATEPTISTS